MEGRHTFERVWRSLNPPVEWTLGRLKSMSTDGSSMQKDLGIRVINSLSFEIIWVLGFGFFFFIFVVGGDLGFGFWGLGFFFNTNL